MDYYFSSFTLKQIVAKNIILINKYLYPASFLRENVFSICTSLKFI